MPVSVFSIMQAPSMQLLSFLIIWGSLVYQREVMTKTPANPSLTDIEGSDQDLPESPVVRAFIPGISSPSDEQVPTSLAHTAPGSLKPPLHPNCKLNFCVLSPSVRLWPCVPPWLRRAHERAARTGRTVAAVGWIASCSGFSSLTRLEGSLLACPDHTFVSTVNLKWEVPFTGATPANLSPEHKHEPP